MRGMVGEILKAKWMASTFALLISMYEIGLKNIQIKFAIMITKDTPYGKQEMGHFNGCVDDPLQTPKWWRSPLLRDREGQDRFDNYGRSHAL